MKTLILYVVGIFISYGALRYMLDNKIVSNYHCFISSLLWIFIFPLGIIMSIIEFINQNIKYYKRHGRNK